MTRFVREFVEVPDHSSLDELIASLVALRDALPEDGEAHMRLLGDDIFGRRLSLSYLRPQTAEEAACDARYEQAHLQSRERQLADLQGEIAALRREAAPVSLAA